MEPNLIGLDDPTNSEATSTDPKELQLEVSFLKKWVTKEEDKNICLEKEKEKATLDVIIERDNLLRRMTSLNE